MPAKNATVASLGRALKTIRVKRGLSQEAAGNTTGIGRSFYGRLERGEASPTYETLVKVADGLETETADLIALADRYRHGR